MKFKHPEAQVARWIEVLGTYEFTTEHRAGRNHGNADALSRKPCDGSDCKQCNKLELNMNDKQPIHFSTRSQKHNGVIRPSTYQTRQTVHSESNEKRQDKTKETVKCNRIVKVSWIQTRSDTEIRKAQLDDTIRKIVETDRVPGREASLERNFLRKSPV